MTIDSTHIDGTPTGATAREQAAKVARRALLSWQDAVWSDLTKLACQAGTGSGDPVVVFEGCESTPTEGDFEEFREELVLATFAGGGRRVELGNGLGTRWMWEQSVTLWDDLRTVLGHVYGYPVDAALVCDLSKRVVYVYEPWFCPQMGPEPCAVLELGSPDDVDDDPFAALLVDEQAQAVETDARLETLLAAHRLTPPTRAGHDPGDCALSDDD